MEFVRKMRKLKQIITNSKKMVIQTNSEPMCPNLIKKV